MPPTLVTFVALMAATQAGGPPAGAALPARVDLVPEFVRLGLTARAQGARDVCSLFAVTALAEFESGRSARRPASRLSVEYLIWAANEATGRTGDQAMFYEAEAGLEKLGICRDGLMPYESTPDPRRSPSAAARDDARTRARRWRVHWVRRWNVARPMSVGEFRGIKSALAAGHPVACGLRWPKEPRGHALLDVPPPDGVRDGHSIALVGYTDDRGQNGGGTFVFRNSAGPEWGDGGYGLMSYAYVRAYANEALWIELVARQAVTPLERFEAESLRVVSRHLCTTNPQDMAEYGGPMWGGGRQLFCRASRGGYVVLGLTVRRSGRYRVSLRATAAPDYGSIQAALDGKPVGAVFDLYSGRVCPAGTLDLGVVDLEAGAHALRVAAVGKDPASGNVFFGLDSVELTAPE
jgi:hypothetical protein